MSERVTEDNKAEDTTTSADTETPTWSMSKLSVLTSHHHTHPVTPVRLKYAIPDSLSASVAGRCRGGLDTDIHPLRMHPPSPSPSLSGQASTAEGRNTPPLPRSPSKIPLQSTPSFDHTASKVSRDTISTRRSRRALLELNIDATNNDVKPHDEELERKDKEQTGVLPTIMMSADKHSSFPRDVGYVEAMRIWYEEKEHEALKTRTRERKAARTAGTADCALASMNANQRL